jgi:glycosyltransferase involved in cell wall biosynthesis
MISVIVPVYNAKEYLEDCVESVLSQTYGNLELILIDDGSADGSGDLCEAFAERDSRVVVIHKENGGVSDARNTGLDAARGDVIAFLDCDDYILPGMYEAMIDMMDKTKTKIAVCTVMDEQEGGKIRKVDTGETMLISGRDALRNLVTMMGDAAEHRETIWFSVWNKLYDAGLFKGDVTRPNSGIRFDPETDSAEDVPVNLAAFAKVDRIIYYEKPYYFWRYRDDSQSSLKTPKALKGGARTSRYIFDYAKTLSEKERPTAVTAAIRHFYWYYTGCVYALSRARKLERQKPAGLFQHARDDGMDDRNGMENARNDADGRSPADYLRLRKYMLALLRATTDDPAYREYTDRRFKAAVWFMQNMPGFFGTIWLCYRKLKRL